MSDLLEFITEQRICPKKQTNTHLHNSAKKDTEVTHTLSFRPSSVLSRKELCFALPELGPDIAPWEWCIAVSLHSTVCLAAIVFCC